MAGCELLAGDDFVAGLQVELARSDGLVLLLTARAASSSWCQAEDQRALALRLPVIVVQGDNEATLPDALERLLRDVQRIQWSSSGNLDLGLHVRRARRRRLRRLVQRVAAIGLPLILLGLVVAWGVSSLDERHLEQTRRGIVDDVRTATAAWSGSDVRARLGQLSTDEELARRLAGIAADPSETSLRASMRGKPLMRYGWAA